MSMNPGATISPFASTTVSVGCGFTSPTAAIRPLTKRTFARRSGAPVPSAMEAPTTIVPRATFCPLTESVSAATIRIAATVRPVVPFNIVGSRRSHTDRMVQSPTVSRGLRAMIAPPARLPRRQRAQHDRRCSGVRGRSRRRTNGRPLVQIACQNELECKAIRRIGHPGANPRFDVPAPPRAIDHGEELMHLIAARREGVHGSEVVVLLERYGPPRRKVIRDAGGRHELEILEAVVGGVDDRVDDDIERLEVPADDRPHLRREPRR